MFHDITVQQLVQDMGETKQHTLIDVRSPSEYADGTIPGSVNIPLFDDAERAEIGTTYKQVSVEAAKRRGLEIVSAKLPRFIEEIEQAGGRKAVFCWRGGMRSKTAATVVSLMGIPVYRLVGGIRSYRKWVVGTLESFDWKPTSIVINGYTGTGKTKLLRQLAEAGYPVLDLESLAGHRGSIFGQIGLHPSNQKTFESKLIHELIRLNGEPYVLVEAESRRIGKVVIPEFLVRSKEKGPQLFIELPLAERVRHVLDDYDPTHNKQACIDAFQLISRRIHTPVAKQIETDLMEDRFEQAVERLLTHYYDPRYEHATREYETNRTIIRAESFQDAVDQVERSIHSMPAVNK